MKIHIEIRPREGGNDVRLLVRDQAAIHARHFNAAGVRCEIVEESKAAIG